MTAIYPCAAALFVVLIFAAATIAEHFQNNSWEQREADKRAREAALFEEHNR